ncbi:hypothetical protein [Aeoliella mucimassa]|uniref:Uncharacterized protein n=1 Tax=Aeoliella mucimassa TaxID=2527972 RepID=A0A518AJI1_9BACT|nr:hypothetical protein [Aeoliella mucimassa]QDU54893.1 hypothetical protein Pan181_10780 [Aeoliella mucimassa]
MDGVAIVVVFVFFVSIAVGARLFAGSMDGDRVRGYIHRQGGKLLSSNWEPFGTGWFGEKNDRIYRVRYRDRDGNIHNAVVKTSMFSGVYFTEDRIVSYAEREELDTSNNREAELASENEELRRRLAELEGDQPN